MEATLKKIFDVVTDPYSSIAQWKEEEKKKVIGCMPMHLPEELVHAAGLEPVIFWRSNEPITLGHSHVYSFNCGLTRSIVDDAVKGKLSFLDGMIFYDICLQGRELPFIINRNARPAFLEVMFIPGMVVQPVYKDFLMENLERLKTSLEGFSGQKITDDSLKKSIELYNKHRKLLRDLYDLRKNNPGVLKSREMVAIVQSGMLMPKEEHCKLLEKLLSELKQRQPLSDKKPRVLLVGCLCQTPHFDILDLIEEEGAVVVDDDIYVGSRYLERDVESDGSPIEALAKRYLRRTPPCPTKVDWEMDWSDYVIDRVKQANGKGVITLLVKFCPPHLCYYPDVKRRLAQANIPEILVEVEHEIVSLEQVRTRLQAFIEEMR
jgi:benzoyl-CoA reductase subunit C